MNSRSEIKSEIINSDILKIFVLLFSFFTLFGMVRLYFMMNGQKEFELIQTLYPWATVTDNTFHNFTRPWVWVTHLGAELSVIGMLSNFLWLYLFGFIIQDLKGKNSVWPLFIFAAIVTALVVCICVAINKNTLSSGYYYGMRASLVAVASAACFFRPTYKVFQMFNGGFSVWILGAIFLLLSLTNGRVDVANVVAILVAALIGFLYTTFLESFFDRLQVRITNNAAQGYDKPKPKKPKYNSPSNIGGPTKVIDISEHKMNALLDKISLQGMDALTPVEKQWLQDYSNKNKTSE